MVPLPQQYQAKVIQMRGAGGRQWLSELPSTINRLANRWGLTKIEPFSLSLNFVADVNLTNGREAVLKVPYPDPFAQREAEVTSQYNGVAMCKLLQQDRQSGAWLLERLRPGENLTQVDEAEALNVACDLIRTMRAHHLRPDGFSTLGERLEVIRQVEAIPGIDRDILLRANKIVDKINYSNADYYLLHGDFHHENILSAGSSWKLIDPKGLFGIAEYELATFIINNLPVNFRPVVENRVRYFAENLDMDEKEIRNWAFCHSILAAHWMIEDNLPIPERLIDLIPLFHSKS